MATDLTGTGAAGAGLASTPTTHSLNPDPSCLYRLGMAHLLGQLGFKRDPREAAPLLQRAAVLAAHLQLPRSYANGTSHGTFGNAAGPCGLAQNSN